MQPTLIDDIADPRLAPYRDIRERDLVGRQGMFIAEGKVVLDVLFSAGRFRPQSALVLENRMAGMAETLTKAPADMPVYVVPSAVMDTLAGFPMHRGVLAIGQRGEPEDLDMLLAGQLRSGLVVVLVGIANHDNVGAIFRNAAAFGVDAVILDHTCCDPLYRKAIRVSVGAALKVPFAIADTDLIPQRLAERSFDQVALSPGGSTSLVKLRRSRRTALYLGSEGQGLPQTLIDRLKSVRIDIAPGFDSLNVAAASAIALHHLASRRGASTG